MTVRPVPTLSEMERQAAQDPLRYRAKRARAGLDKLGQACAGAAEAFEGFAKVAHARIVEPRPAAGQSETGAQGPKGGGHG